MERIHTDYLFDPEINADKMIFLAGPRQVEKSRNTAQYLWLPLMKSINIKTGRIF